MAKNDDPNFGIRLKGLMKRAGLNNKKLADNISAAPSTITPYVDVGRIPEAPILLKIAQLLNISMEFLLTGEGPQSIEDSERVEETRASYHIRDEYVYIPQVAGRISAGTGRLPEETIEMKVAFRKEWIHRKGDSKNMVLIKVEGDSMEPTLHAGDTVLVDRGRNYITPGGGVYAIALDDHIMVKRVQQLSSGIRVMSDNKNYDPYDVIPDKIKIHGKVIWFAREMEK